MSYFLIMRIGNFGDGERKTIRAKEGQGRRRVPIRRDVQGEEMVGQKERKGGRKCDGEERERRGRGELVGKEIENEFDDDTRIEEPKTRGYAVKRCLCVLVAVTKPVENAGVECYAGWWMKADIFMKRKWDAAGEKQEERVFKHLSKLSFPAVKVSCWQLVLGVILLILL